MGSEAGDPDERRKESERGRKARRERADVYHYGVSFSVRLPLLWSKERVNKGFKALDILTIENCRRAGGVVAVHAFSSLL